MNILNTFGKSTGHCQRLWREFLPQFRLSATIIPLAIISSVAHSNTPLDLASNGATGRLISDSLRASGYYQFQRTPSRSQRLDGWAFSFDNDILVPASRDQDYTYGVAITLAGEAVRDHWAAPSRPLSWLNNKLRLNGETRKPVQYVAEFGAYGFTPEVKTDAERDSSDRPYASILYVTTIEELHTPDPQISWRTSLTLGVLGLDIVGEAQNQVHDWVGSDSAEGWDSQISDGGELTARYSLARQKRLRAGVPNLELKVTTQASVGYLTEVSYGISMRYGRIASRWQSFNPELASYREQATQSVDQLYLTESYWMAGAAVKVRAYNVFLEGQFRRSDVEYRRSELNYGILESWVGYSHSFRNGMRVTYLLRGHTSEVKDGVADRNVLWGGLTMSQVF